MVRTALAALIAALVSFAPAGSAQEAPHADRARFPVCAEAPDRMCAAGRVFTAQEAEARLAGKDRTWWVEGETLHLIERAPAQPSLCCFYSWPLGRVAGAADLWALSLHLPRLQEAVLDFGWSEGAALRLEPWRGPKAPAPAPLKGAPADWIHKVELPSAAMGEPVDLFVYAPPNEGRPLPVIYVADGSSALHHALAAHALLVAGLAPKVILVGVEPASRRFGAAADRQTHMRSSELRSQDYLRGYKDGQARFAAHRRMLLEEVLPYAEKTWGASSEPSQRAVMGVSNGAAWALDMAATHPDRFGTAIALSFGWAPTLEAVKGARIGQVYLGAGLYEPPFLTRTREAADLLRPTVGRLHLDVRPAGHSMGMWTDQFADALRWAFAPAPAAPPPR